MGEGHEFEEGAQLECYGLNVGIFPKILMLKN